MTSVNQTDGIQKRVIDDIENRRNRMINLLSELIAIPSVNPPGEEGHLAEYVAATFERMGLEVETYDVFPGRPNVIGTLRGEDEGRALLLSGHLDVVPPGTGWGTNPFAAQIKEDRVYGRGASDMKGGLAAMMTAARSLAANNVRLAGDLSIAAVVDEEIGEAGTRSLVQRGVKANMAVIGEPTNLAIDIAHKGGLSLLITVKGRAAHAALRDRGVDAISKMAKIICALDQFEMELRKKRHRLLGYPTLSVDLIRGGIKSNIIPDLCTIAIDRRLIIGEEAETAVREVENVIEELRKKDPEIEARVELTESKVEPMEISEEEEVVKCLKRAFEAATGFEPIVSGFAACCDAHLLVNDAKIPTAIFGPGKLELSHIIDEYIEIEQVVTAAKTYAMLAIQCLGSA